MAKTKTAGYNDFDTFAHCSVPKTVEQLSKDLDLFLAEVSEARKKYQLQNVSVIVLHPVKEGEEESQTIATKHYGDSNVLHAMLAHAYGAEKKLLADRIQAMENAVKLTT